MSVPAATIRFSRLMKWIVIILIMVMTFVLFELIHEVAIALFGSVVIAYIFFPVITWITQWVRVSRLWAVVLFYGVVALLIAGSIMWLVPLLTVQYQLMRQELPQVLNRI